MNQESIEIRIYDKIFKLSLDNFTKEAADEIKKTFENQDMKLIELIQKYLSKVQECSELNNQLKSLLQKIPS
ncbi:hypothetical protein BKH42_07545 [Helicobacter sp. 13S00482-2]|uniref:hypothetical protein n=1 Tax=Helicobacter sp. 13S00482-2 TaxID=1476200 RepID=UPI000BA5F2F1|nr:hypothetical protein [Helicobacter sp. 13S00482-2]PAF53136.1 hypothetical protein BKH42_07545 [Helicobacter sp. 13S00482-2]